MPPKSEARIFNINDFIGWNDKGELMLNYQQEFWDLHTKQQFIYRIFEGLPISPIQLTRYINLEVRKVKNVVWDGNKKLDAIISYCNNEFAVNGITFENLNDEERARFLNTGLFASFIFITTDEIYNKKHFSKKTF